MCGSGNAAADLRCATPERSLGCCGFDPPALSLGLAHGLPIGLAYGFAARYPAPAVRCSAALPGIPRLCRREVRKGFAFPESDETELRLRLGG